METRLAFPPDRVSQLDKNAYIPRQKVLSYQTLKIICDKNVCYVIATKLNPLTVRFSDGDAP